MTRSFAVKSGHGLSALIRPALLMLHERLQSREGEWWSCFLADACMDSVKEDSEKTFSARRD